MNNSAIINLTIFQLFLASLISLLLIIISKKNKFGTAKEIFRNSLQMIIQLFILGYILIILLKPLHPYLAILYIFVMLFLAIRTFKKRLLKSNQQFIKNGAIAIVIGSFISLVYFIGIIVRPTSIINPQYVIPVYGMISGNTLTSVVLGINTFNESVRTQKTYIYTLINLGVEPQIALNNSIKTTIAAAINPTLTSMASMGLVSLPGMMTGQILSGVDPFTAVKYQVAIMFAILGSVFISNFISLYLNKKAIINSQGELLIDLID